MKTFNLSSLHLMLMGLFLILVVCWTTTALPPPPYPVKEEFAMEQQADMDEKQMLLDTLLGAIKEMSPEDMEAYMDKIKDTDAKRNYYIKKANSICHFKLCNLGNRAGR